MAGNQEIRDAPVIDAEQIIARARSGAFWVSALSLMAVPLAYYRSWILARLGDNHTVVGVYAVLMLFMDVVATFAVFGGGNVLVNLLPKVSDQQKRRALLTFYLGLSLTVVLAFDFVVIGFPQILEFLMRKEVPYAWLTILLLIAPLFVVHQILTFSLNGLMQYRTAELLTQAQLITISTVATVAWFVAAESFAMNAFGALSTTLVCTFLLTSLIAAGFIRRQLKGLWASPLRYPLPSGFWRFSSALHVNTLTSFAYNSVDQIIVLTAIGIEALGAYFLLLQIAFAIRIIPQRLSKIMLSSFAALLSRDDYQNLVRAYQKLARYMLLLSVVISLTIVGIGPWLLGFFSNSLVGYYEELMVLVLVYSVGCLGPLNTNLILSTERAVLFATCNIIQVAVQLLVVVLLIHDMGVMGVVIGRFSGVVFIQLANFSIIRFGLGQVRIGVPREYLLAQLVVLFCTAFAGWFGVHYRLEIAACCGVATAIYLALGRYTPAELRRVANRQTA